MSPFVDGSDIIRGYFKKIKGAVAVGTPIRPELFEKRDKSLIIKQFGLDENKKTLLVTGGSQGSVAINQAIEKIAYMLVNRYNIVHVCGKGKLIKSKFKNYHTMEYCSEMEKLYSIADLAVSRAGANTLFELISLKIPTLAIPLPKGNSRGDQVENALYFKDKGLIDLLFEENASPLALYEKIIELDANSERIKRNCMEVDYSKNAEKIAEILKNYRR